MAVSLLSIAHVSRAQPVHIFDVENALPHNRVKKLYVDSRNFLWICTDDGFARFDGHQFVKYTTGDGIPHKYVNDVLETRVGEYWIASDGGLSRFNPLPGQERFITYAPSGAQAARHINAVIEEEDGTLLVGTSAGLFRFTLKHGTGTFNPIDLGSSGGLPGPVMVNAIARDAHGSMWLATNRGLYRGARNAGWTHFGNESGFRRWIGTEPVPFINSFAHDTDGRLWVAFKGGFGRIAVHPNRRDPILDFVQTGEAGAGRDVRALWFAKDGRRWIATNTGLKEWVTDSTGVSRFRKHTIRDEFAQEVILCISEDIGGSLWIGTRRSGLVRIGPSLFRTWGAAEGLELGVDQILIEDEHKQVSVFDVGGSRTRIYRPEGQRFVPVLPGLPKSVAAMPHWLQMALEDRKGAWWFSTAKGLFRFPTLYRPFDLRLMPTVSIERFFEDAAGDLWMSNWAPHQAMASLARWDRRSGAVHDESHRLPQDARRGIAAFAQDHGGTLWIGLQNQGKLLRLKDGHFQPISASLSGHINRLFFDSKGRLWVTSTQSGLGLVENPDSADPTLRRYTRAQGMSADEVWCVTEDQLGRIYAGTAKGVDRLDPATGRITHYSAADGLIRGDIRSALRDQSGDLWFASAQGISRLTPGDRSSTAPPRARITAIRTAGVPYPLSEFGETAIGLGRLRSHQNSIQVDFAGTDYHLLTPLRYQFRLGDGSETDSTAAWQDLGASATAHLLNLGAGDFSFKVRALAADGSPGEPASLAFSILQPIWRTWWIQLACAIAVSGLVYWLRTRRLQQQLAIERVRSRIAIDLHDDIGAGLSRISVIGETLKRRVNGKDKDHEVERMLDDIAESSRQLITDMSDIVWSLDPRHDQVGELAGRLRAFGSDLLETRGVDWTVDASPENLDATLSPGLRRQLYLAFREGIHNVAKHSGARTATLRLSFEDGLIVGELTDDGCGITPRSKAGNGIASMRTRAKELDGEFEICARTSGGTAIRITVPNTRA